MLPTSCCHGSNILPCRALNNVAILDLGSLQRMLGGSDLRVEIFHAMSYLLTLCTRQWEPPAAKPGMQASGGPWNLPHTLNAQPGAASHHSPLQVQNLLKELLLLIGHFALLEPRNQQVLLWGREPTVIHKLGRLPFPFFCNPQLLHILCPTLLAVSLHSEHTCKVRRCITRPASICHMQAGS